MQATEPTQPAIGDYALIGDTRAAALCSTAGSIDWLCLPRMDSDPVFGRLVGGPDAGHFSIAVADAREVRRSYRPDTAILETTWTTSRGEVRLTEGMVLDTSSSFDPQMLLVRRVQAIGGPTTVRIELAPHPGLTGPIPKARRYGDIVVCTWGARAISLQASSGGPPPPGGVHECVVGPEPLTLVLGFADRQPLVFVEPAEAWRQLEACGAWWRRWCQGVQYDGPFPDMVERSLITLRLLTYSPSGAPVAAPTTSLPEVIGGDANWDYRLSWPRDAGMGVAAFLDVGLLEEAVAYLRWLTHASRLSRPRLDVLYTLDGRPGPEEREVPGVPGYRGSLPVRLGNAASDQTQHDVYGWVLDAACSMAERGGGLEPAVWRSLSRFGSFVAGHWREPDAGMWERRGSPAHFVHSKVWAWLALDRATRTAKRHPVGGQRTRAWADAATAIATEVRRDGFDPDRNTYVREYGKPDLDAALLLLPGSGLEPQGSPRLEGTVEAVRRELAAGGPLLFRYRAEADGPPEGAFVACSFWLAQALGHLGRGEEALDVLEATCRLANEVGLFAEEMDPNTGEHLGNFPQALSHSALVQAALTVARATEASAAVGTRRGSRRTPRGR